MKDKKWPLGVSTVVLCGVRWKSREEAGELAEFLCQFPRQSRAHTAWVESCTGRTCPGLSMWGSLEQLWCLQGQWLKTLHFEPDLKTTEITIKILLAFSAFLLYRKSGFSTVPIKWDAAFLANCRCTWVSILAFCVWNLLQQCCFLVGWGTALGFPWPWMSSQEDNVAVFCLLMPAQSCHIPVATLWLCCSSWEGSSANTPYSAAVPVQGN